ncbi:cinnamoyl-CoA reductase 1-like [Phragmites australis]|uniref:cinnamoyl-CoA reductase 1-like n=1 Tax=Phragmites australis TaxID=29695 RepID=UPI002D79552D|nr:cinnamoyl-CoA reductase 1-like [Phragmites australis]
MAAGGAGGGAAARGGLVCVTGGSGFIGSWLVRGYTVHATVKNLQDDGETKHMQALGGADTRVRLFQMDLLDPASLRPVVEGARGVCHIASPVAGGGVGLPAALPIERRESVEGENREESGVLFSRGDRRTKIGIAFFYLQPEPPFVASPPIPNFPAHP